VDGNRRPDGIIGWPRNSSRQFQGIGTKTVKNATDDEYSDEEAERRMREGIRRSFEMPHKPYKTLVGTTPRAKEAARRRAAKDSPRSK
jgi:hypothetical protein